MNQIIAMIAMLIAHSSYPNAEYINRQEMYCLSKAVYHEARGEEIMGQAAVAHVVLNRVRSEKYPSTICQVVNQPHQFTDIRHTQPDYSSEEWTTTVEVAILSYVGFIDDPTEGSKWYYAHDKVRRPSWAKKKEVVTKIGGHTFLDNY